MKRFGGGGLVPSNALVEALVGRLGETEMLQRKKRQWRPFPSAAADVEALVSTRVDKSTRAFRVKPS